MYASVVASAVATAEIFESEVAPLLEPMYADNFVASTVVAADAIAETTMLTSAVN
jgi:hypothetical protein